MTLAPAAQFAVSAALGDVQTAAKALEAVRDADAAREALHAVRMAAIRAYTLLNDAEVEARRLALARTFA